ncbi:MAG: hypothetical protein K2I08_09920 [Muribaculaceae bacterium]|nr:hypothetical protein [Muribaculaceae bacterium]
MNKYIYSAAAFLSLSCIALTSCQNEMEQIGAPAGKEVLLRVTANRGDAETRTTLEHDGNGGLTCKWSEGDQLLVVNNSKGTKLGVITITDGVGTPDGTFEGKVNLDGQEALSLVYLGNAGNAESYESNNIAIDLSKQDGSFESLPKLDVLTAEAKVDDQNFLPTGNVIETSITMTRQLAFGHFTLDFGGDVTLAAGDVITIAGEGLKSTGKVNFKNGGSVPNVTNPGTTITVTKADAGNDFYITMLPCGEVTPTFTVVKDNVTYTGSLGSHTWVSGEYVRAGEKQGVSIKMEKIAAKPVSDGKILGIKWAAVNDRSWIDCTKTGDDYAFYFSYIPGISLADQGININYTGGNIENGTNNPYVFHYQWGRNFGFAASSGDLTGVRVPNDTNLPNSWASKYHYYQKVAGTKNATYSAQNPDIFIYNANGNDWCSTNMSSWPINVDEDGGRMSVILEGFRLPTKADFQKLLPGESGVKYTAKKTFTVDGETIRPVYAQTTDEGTTVVWTILNSTTNYMALYEFAGSYTLDQLTLTMFEEEVLDYIDFPAHGIRSGTSQATLQYYQSEGWYWAGTSSATGYADMLRFTIDGNNLTIYVAGMPRKSALSVRCIYED